MREYQQFMKRLDYEPEMRVYCDLYQLVVDPSESPALDKATAGVVDFLGRTLLKESAFSSNPDRIKKTLTLKRKQLEENYFEICKAIIAGIFRYTFEEIEGWDEETFFDRLAKAEMVSGVPLDVHPLGAAEDPANTQSHPNAPKKDKRPLTKAQQMVLQRTMEARRST